MYQTIPTQSSLIDSKIPLTQKGAASGVCPLNSNSLIDSMYLPSYVDDVLEYVNQAAFPATGETGKIYIDKATSLTYRWSGSSYIAVDNQTLGSVASLSSSSGVVTIDCSALPKLYQLSLTENVTSWSFTNLPASGYIKEIDVQITQHASSAKTCVSPATSGRTARGVWVASTALSSIEVLGLRIFSDGTVSLFPSGVFA